MKIAILGAGAFGTALGGILAEKGHDIDYYDSKVEREKLSDVVADAKITVLCTPSKAVPYLLPHLPKEKLLIVATKGILGDECFADFRDYSVLSGPGFAADIKAHKKTFLTVTDEKTGELFKTDYLNFDYTDDKKGVLLCGALKNVYALLSGYLDFKPDTLEWEKFILQTAEEMQALLSANGACSETVDLACGIGDLRLTCNLPSRNYEFGQLMRKDIHITPNKTVEGLSTLSKIIRREIEVPESCARLKEIIALETKRRGTWD
ncbi:hypothetical protein IJ117_01610 [Candidatus Saccharibacteria bacterium]|nr:hypothetical protein [Candidatus Saccharibacteria bacterium]